MTGILQFFRGIVQYKRQENIYSLLKRKQDGLRDQQNCLRQGSMRAPFWKILLLQSWNSKCNVICATLRRKKKKKQKRKKDLFILTKVWFIMFRIVWRFCRTSEKQYIPACNINHNLLCSNLHYMGSKDRLDKYGREVWKYILSFNYKENTSGSKSVCAQNSWRLGKCSRRCPLDICYWLLLESA